ncbi:Rad4-domain-containing protein [Glonium stellatum]|uniref:Rad4-domain-containing protein n=1 Tax=Glonium stellatum TaxID=574774 RepID=A0A8E2JKZ0_9PEZI|nr:Rad4-domain-containing protein [Glonium stellatum]
MPPFVPRKRHRSPSPTSSPLCRRPTPIAPPRRVRETIFETLDSAPPTARSLEQTKALLEEEDDISELSDISSDEFEDVIISGARSSARGRGKKHKALGKVDSDSEEGAEWEDALGSHHHTEKHLDEHVTAPVPSGDLELTLSSSINPTAFSATTDGGKKGPSKIERRIRTMTHCIHVQFLMFHNLIRNAWIQDKEVQRILLKSLSKGCWKEVEAWWRNAGIRDGYTTVVEGGYPGGEIEVESASAKDKGKAKQAPGKPVTKSSRARMSDSKAGQRGNNGGGQRDWGASSAHLEQNAPNLSAGDPLLRLLKYLSAFWKQKFRLTAPCLRKRGYLPPWALEAEIEAWHRDTLNVGEFGERVESLNAFRELARKCEGSKDVGQQLFTALLRGLGIEARMVASLQPIGFGWSRAEEGKVRKNSVTAQGEPKEKRNAEDGKVKIGINLALPKKANPESSLSTEMRNRKLFDNDNSPISQDNVGLSDLSCLPSDSNSSNIGSKTTGRPKVGLSNASRKYGQELPYPTYWTEALSPTTRIPIAVSPIPLPIIAPSSNPDLLAQFYPRGAASESAKQVFCYLIAFSPDGTAKDVTTRYIPRRVWPGKTKGARIPAEKIPVHNGRGKVRKWEEWDWFKSVMRPYERSAENRTLWDEIEDKGDLVSAKPTKAKAVDEEGGKETLQGYKSSTEFVLERHLRREEALGPDAKLARYFTTGKGDKEIKEPVYLRKDVVTCKTVESWHKEGRRIKGGEQPLKFVPMRAVTVTRKREIEEREREEGGKVKQGLYSEAQTEWIIPDPIQDGRIPRNVFGNIDVYVPTMVPEGAVHIPLRGTVRVCKRLGVDFAEACTGFEFGKQRAVPVLIGVVVAKENEGLVIDAWEAEEAERKRKEQSKKEKLVLGLWKKFLLGLRIAERMKREYGEEDGGLLEDVNPFTKEKSILEDAEEDAVYYKRTGFSQQAHDEHLGGGFIRDEDEEDTGGLVVEHEDDSDLRIRQTAPEGYTQTPISLLSAQYKINPEDMPIGTDSEGYQFEEGGARALHKMNKRDSSGRGRGRGERGVRDGRGSIVSKTLQPGRPSKTIPRKKYRISGEDDSKSPNTSDHVPGMSNFEDESMYDAVNENNADRSMGGKISAVGTTRLVPKRKAAQKSQAAVRSHYFHHDSDENGDVLNKGRVRKNARGNESRQTRD